MMKIFFYPVIKFLNKFKYSIKIGIISILLLLFTSGLLIIISKDIDSRINFVEKEVMGLEYINGMKDLLQDMQQRRALITTYFYEKRLLGGTESAKSELTLLDKKIDEDISLINDAEKKYNHFFKMDKLWFQIINDRQSLKNNSLNLTIEESFKKHSLVINKIINLIYYISDVSNLVLDFDIKRFYLARSISHNLPELTENIAQARGVGFDIIVRKK